MSKVNTPIILHGEIMVIEDNTADLKFMSKTLTKAGYRVRSASDGELALRSVQAKLPDLILLDINLPGMKGVEVCSRLKADPATKDLPVIFISALGEIELKVKALEAGGTDYVTKPVESSELLARIDIHLNMYRLQRKLVVQSEKLIAEIEERKLAEEELLNEKSFSEAIIESIPGMLYVYDDQGTHIQHNKRHEDMTGYSTEELSHMNPLSWYDDKADILRVEAAISDVFTKGYGEVEVPMRIKNGEKLMMHFTGSRLVMNGKKYFVGVGTDITDRKKAEDALRVSHERFLTVLDSIDANIYVADMESYEILFMNKNLMNTFGRNLTGELCWEGLKGESEPCKHCTNDQLIDENGKPTGLCTWQNKNPITGKWYINNDRAIEWSDGRLVRIEIATDITDLKHMEEELRQAQKRESIGTLTGGIAHDFNNIMGIILGNTELALEDVPESNRAYSNLEAIKTASRRAANIVKQLSNLSRITDQKLQPIEIAPVIKDVLNFLRSTIPNTIDIQQDIQITNETILADPTQIKQIMMNLCINASHAMEQTGGKLTTTVENVFLDDSSAKDYPDLKSGKYVKVVVSDTGPGIDPKIINRIFDPYFTTKGIGKGSGMGLAVVHGIVKSHSGAITIDSTLGKGTKFIMFFPLVTEKPIVEVQTT